jgi:hypothetical protein
LFTLAGGGAFFYRIGDLKNNQQEKLAMSNATVKEDLKAANVAIDLLKEYGKEKAHHVQTLNQALSDIINLQHDNVDVSDFVLTDSPEWAAAICVEKQFSNELME